MPHTQLPRVPNSNTVRSPNPHLIGEIVPDPNVVALMVAHYVAPIRKQKKKQKNRNKNQKKKKGGCVTMGSIPRMYCLVYDALHATLIATRRTLNI